MRIALKPTGSEILTWLAGDPDLSIRRFTHVRDLQIDPQIMTEMQGGVRKAAKIARDRLNLSTTISFSTTREFDTVEQAELWAQDYDTDFARTGTLILESLQEGGGVSRRYLPDCVVNPPRRLLIGLAVALSYTVIGGQLTNVEP